MSEVVAAGEPEATTADTLKEKGNELFRSKDVIKAIEIYTEGLKLDPDRVDILTNRSAAFLTRKYFHRALEDAEEALKIDGTHRKGIFRKTKALFGLGRYSDAVAFLESKSGDFEDLMKRAKTLEEQEKKGEYDIVTLLEALHQDKMSSINFDEDLAKLFVSDKIELSPNVGEGRGRGVVAKSDIPAGTLIVAAKAFIMSKNDYECLATGGTPSLVTDIMEALNKEPERIREFYNMYGGDKFANPDGSSGDTGSSYPEISQERIEAICDLNRFETYDMKFEFQTLLQNPKVGIWVFPSYFNSDCVDRNCCHEIIGDFMFIRVIRPVKAGEELLISYKGFEEIVRPQRNYLCTCRLCTAETKEDPEIRFELERKLKAAEEELDSDKIKELIKDRMKEAPAPELKLYLIPWILKLSTLDALQMELNQVAANYMNVLKILKEADCVSSESFFAVLNMVSYEIFMGNMSEAKRWTTELKTECLVHWGTTEIIRVYGAATLYLVEEFGLIDLLK